MISPCYTTILLYFTWLSLQFLVAELWSSHFPRSSRSILIHFDSYFAGFNNVSHSPWSKYVKILNILWFPWFNIPHFPGSTPSLMTFRYFSSQVTKSRMLREMPPVPLPAPEEPAPPEDDIMAARWEVEAELKAQEAWWPWWWGFWMGTPWFLWFTLW